MLRTCALTLCLLCTWGMYKVAFAEEANELWKLVSARDSQFAFSKMTLETKEKWLRESTHSNLRKHGNNVDRSATFKKLAKSRKQLPNKDLSDTGPPVSDYSLTLVRNKTELTFVREQNPAMFPDGKSVTAWGEPKARIWCSNAAGTYQTLLDTQQAPTLTENATPFDGTFYLYWLASGIGLTDWASEFDSVLNTNEGTIIKGPVSTSWLKEGTFVATLDRSLLVRKCTIIAPLSRDVTFNMEVTTSGTFQVPNGPNFARSAEVRRYVTFNSKISPDETTRVYDDLTSEVVGCSLLSDRKAYQDAIKVEIPQDVVLRDASGTE